jgi:hypothetical protein
MKLEIGIHIDVHIFKMRASILGILSSLTLSFDQHVNRVY